MSAKTSKFIAAVLFLFLGAGWRPLAGQESHNNLKANLDLPYDAGGAEGLEEDDSSDSPDIIIFWGQQYEGDGIFFCCDKSDSMKGAPMTRLQSEMIRSIRQFSQQVEFGIVFFDSKVYKFPGTGNPATATPELRAAGEAWVRSMEAGYSSGYKEALLTALSFAHRSTAKRKMIIALGDGRPNLPGYDQVSYANDTLLSVAQRNFQAVRINTICIGDLNQADEKWMRALATQNAGSYARIITSQ